MDMERRRLPKGIENFEDIITKNYYYVDKTMLIKDINFNVKQEVHLLLNWEQDWEHFGNNLVKIGVNL